MDAEAVAFDLDAIKCSWAAFKAVTGIGAAGSHRRCFLRGHEDAHGSVSVTEVSDGVITWHCLVCGKGGTVIDALALAERITPAEAIRRLAAAGGAGGRFGMRVRHCGINDRRGTRPSTIIEPTPPVPDTPRLKLLVSRAANCLLHDPDICAKWPASRGIPLAVAERYELGFLKRVTFPEWPTWAITDTWVIPVFDTAGNMLAAKLHRENPPPKSPKCLWAPVGTTKDPATGRLRHGYSTLYPPPEWAVEWAERAAIQEFDGGVPRPDAERFAGLESGWLYLLPGELKALAVIGAGRAATSITAGESHRWTPGMISRLRRHRICLVYDDDEAGWRFRDVTLNALRGVVLELRAITFGQEAESDGQEEV